MKKRYMFTLTESNVTKLQGYLKRGNLPPSTLSFAVDEFLAGMGKMFDIAVPKGKFTVVDYFNLMGEQMELIQEDEKKEAEQHVQKQKRNKISNKKGFSKHA